MYQLTPREQNLLSFLLGILIGWACEWGRKRGAYSGTIE